MNTILKSAVAAGLLLSGSQMALAQGRSAASLKRTSATRASAASVMAPAGGARVRAPSLRELRGQGLAGVRREVDVPALARGGRALGTIDHHGMGPRRHATSERRLSQPPRKSAADLHERLRVRALAARDAMREDLRAG